MGTQTVYTVKDFEKLVNYYPNLSGMMMDEFSKAALTTADTGAISNIFGARSFLLLASAPTIFGVLPKKPFLSGWRIKSARGQSSSIGLADGASVGSAVEDTYVEVSCAPKLCSFPMDVGAMLEALEGVGDVVSKAQIMESVMENFQTSISDDLTADNGTAITNNVYSIDHVCASYAEVTAAHDGAGSAYTANDADYLGLDRDGVSTYDAYVSINSGTDRALSETLIDGIFENCPKFWSNWNNKAFVTGFDTANDIGALLRANSRYNDAVLVSMGFNGISTLPGANAGFAVASYRQIPITNDAQTQADTASRLYCLDMDNLEFGVLKALQVLQSSDHLAVGAYVTRYMPEMYGELQAHKFGCHGKIRDLL